MTYLSRLELIKLPVQLHTLRQCLVSFGAVILSVFVLVSSNAAALTTAQKNVFGENIHYFNTETGTTCSASASSTGSISSGSVYILGDSITVRTAPDYQAAFQKAGLTTSIDGSSGRSFDNPGTDGNHLNGFDAIAQDKSQIQQAAAIVIALGTNGDDSTPNIDKAISIIKSDNKNAPIYWVDTFGLTGFPFGNREMGQMNTNIYGEAASQGYQVTSWAKTVDSSIDPQSPNGKQTDKNGYIETDAADLGVHPTPTGSTALANLVVGAVTNNNSAQLSGTCACSTGNVTLVGGTNAQKVWNFFIGQGLTAIATASVMGNLNLESADSGFDPAVKQAFTTQAIPSTGDGYTGYGIAQWTDQARQAGLFKLIDAASLSQYYGAGYGNPDTDKNITPSAINTLLGIELNYAWSGDSITIKSLEGTLNSQPDVTSATTYFQNTYENPQSKTGSLQQRIDYANSFLQQFAGGGGVGGAGSGTSCGSSVLGGVSSVKDGLAWAHQFVSDTSSKYNTSFTSLNDQTVKYSGLTTEVIFVAHHDNSGPTCWGASDCGQCTAASGWFINNMTTAPGASSSNPTPWGNGIDIVNNLKAKGVSTGSDPQPFSIFSTNAYSSSAGHTGLVLGVLGDGSVITLENNMNGLDGTGTGNLTIREYSNIKQYFQSQGGSYLEFAYLGSYMKNNPGGLQ